MAEDRTFTLVGKFDDQITPSLKKLNRTFAAFEKTINSGMGRSFRGLNKDFRSFAKDLNSIGGIFDRKATRGVNRFRDGIKAAGEDAKQLGVNLSHAARAGDGAGQNFRDGLRGAQEEAKTLGSILQANALIKVGEAFTASMQAGARGTMGILSKGTDFIRKQFSGAVQDQLLDIQSRGALFGSLNKSKMFGQGPGDGASAEEREIFVNAGYKQAKNVNRAMEAAIGDVVRTSTVSTATITTLSRQLNDNLLPTLLKAKGITDLSGMSRDQLDSIMVGEKGVGKDLATLYEQIGSVVTSPSFAPMAARGVSEFLGKGTVNRQISIFEQNPVLVEALQENVAKYGNTMEGRIRALKEAFEVAMPAAALAEARNSIAGGLQSIGDSLTNQSVGVLSMAADIANQGEKTLALMKQSGVYDSSIETFTRRQGEVIKTMKEKNSTQDEINAVTKQQEKDLKKYRAGLEDLYTSADSPIEILGATLGPTLQSFANMISNFDNVFIGPVNNIVRAIGPALTKLQDNFDNLSSEVLAGDISPAEALGRGLAEVMKSVATLFKPEGLVSQSETALGKMFDDFMAGFNSIEGGGEKYLTIVMDGLKDLLLRVFFNEGNPLKGTTPIANALAGVFSVFALPSFIGGLAAALLPFAVRGMGSMMLKAFAAPAAAGVAGAGGAGAAGVAGIATIPVAGWVLALAAALVLFERPVMAFTDMLQGLGTKMQESSNWLTSSFGQITQGIGQLLGGITKFFNGLWEVVSGLITGDTDRVIAGIKKLFSGIGDVFVGIGRLVGGMGGVVVVAIGNLMKTIGDLIIRATNRLLGINMSEPPEPSGAPKGGIYGTPAATPTPKPKPGGTLPPPRLKGGIYGRALGNPGVKFGNLGQAVNYEMANKPPGSDLVIANSSETVIPAAGGNAGGMVDFIRTMYSGFTSVVAALSRVQQAQGKSLGQINQTLVVNQQQTNTRLAKLETKFSVPGAGSVGGVDSFTPMASGHGLTMTSGNRPGDKGWHGVNRARDYSNGTGPTPQMMTFARFLASNYGRNLKELIYTPLGFSIKDGQKVPPYARAGHYNHVHVAYAGGPGRPAFFSTQREAMDWENKATLGNVKVSSITSNSSEAMGSGVTVNAPITIHQQPGQSSEQLASLVAMELAAAIRQARSSSMYG